MTDLGLYLHIPFCLQKCGYCDFCSYPDRLADRTRYIERLCRDLAAAAPPQATVQTVYLGGGTPSLLSETDLSLLFATLERHYTLAADAEITCEVNPKTADFAKFSLLKSLGINRISLGVQSLEDKELRLLGRIHTAADARRCFADARRAGFDNISVDLMTGIPAATAESLARTVRGIAELSPEHVSAYALKIEEGTPFARRRAELPLPDEEGAADAFDLAARLLTEAGYTRYEISNYARPGRESRHNLRYWRGEDYLGFGVAAYSCYGGERWGHPRELDAYLRGDPLPKIDRERLTPSEQEREYLILRLRLAEGLSKRDYAARFGRDFDALYQEPLARLSRFFCHRADRVAFTPEGMAVSNALLVELLSVLDPIESES